MTPLKVKEVHELAPEQQKALTVLQTNLSKASELFLQNEQPTKFFTTGYMAFSDKPLPKLPHEETWIWNQSNGKVTVKTEAGRYVTLQKLNTRKKKNCAKPPSYKVWMCYISRSVDQPHYLNFLWCEKGIPAKDSSSSASPDGNRSESSDGSSENTSPDSFYQSFEQQSSPPDSFGAPFRRSSNSGSNTKQPYLLTNGNYTNSTVSPAPTSNGTANINHGSTNGIPTTLMHSYLSQASNSLPSNGNRLPSLETLLSLRKIEADKGNSTCTSLPSNKRPALHNLPDNAKIPKLNHSPNISLAPLRNVPSSAPSNGYRFTEHNNAYSKS